VAHLQDTSGTPRDLVQDQARLAERSKRADWQIDECVASIGNLGELTETLNHIMQGTLYGQFAASPAVVPVSQQRAMCFSHLVHPKAFVHAWEPNATDAIGAAATREDVDRALACPGVGLEAILSRSSPETEPPLRVSHPRAQPLAVSGETSPFLFVSYARSDSARVYQVVERLTQAGISSWTDRTLIAGDQWLDELERKLRECCGILAFVSPAFAASRYCGREVQYADALARKIIPFYLAPTELSGALKFVFQGTQHDQLDDVSRLERLLAAIRRQTPEASSAR
jgi:hypothetical protein